VDPRLATAGRLKAAGGTLAGSGILRQYALVDEGRVLEFAATVTVLFADIDDTAASLERLGRTRMARGAG
jgi:hypothetical protein